MMKKFYNLVKGEFSRLIKYNVLLVSFIVTILWILSLIFIKDFDLIINLLPIIIMIDTTLMAPLYIGSILFFEKDEQTIISQLVTPTSYNQQIIAKVIVNLIHTMISVLLIVLSFYFIKNIQVNWYILIPSLLVVSIFHSFLGYIFSYHSKDFISLLFNITIYAIIFTVPSLLNSFNVFFKGETWSYILTALPPQASGILFEVSFGASALVHTILSFGYLIALSIFSYCYYVLPKYQQFSLKAGGS